MTAIEQIENKAVDAAAESLWGKLSRHVKTRGLGGAAMHATRRLHARCLEAWLGINTSGSIHADELGSEGTRYGYQPIDYHSFFTAMSRVGWSRDDVFADYGCGLGRAVVLAARYPLRRVFGVELSQELVEAAEDNVRRARRKLRCADVTIHCADATQFETPDDLTLLFMYNPFGGEVLQEAMDRVHESLQRKPRRLQIIYALPQTDDDALADLPWLRLVECVHTANYDWERLSIYESVNS